MLRTGIALKISLPKETTLAAWLKRSNGFWLTVYASLASFCLYTSVYAFRKTFAAATFDDIVYWGLGYKSLLVISQVLGYGLSKFIGIRIISELKSKSRSAGILLMIAIAFISWLLFAITPRPYNMVFLFLNGLPLGMVWGMIFGYLEGRRMTEVLGASLSVSFIFSAGLCRSVGAYLIRDWHVSESWMPFVACCIFLLPLLVFLYLLDQLPAPTKQDEALRTRRQPMNKAERRKFITTFLPGIVLFVLAYMMLTAFRDFRDNFSAEVWQSLGYGNSPGIFTATEVPVSIAVLMVMGSLMLIKNNQIAFMVNHLIILIGLLLIGASTYLFQHGVINAPWWMMLSGVGLYLGYVPFNSIFFDRLIAAFRYAGTVGFIMYVADAFGYLASIVVLFVKELGLASVSWLDFFVTFGYFISASGAAFIICSTLYFYFKHKRWPSASTA